MWVEQEKNRKEIEKKTKMKMKFTLLVYVNLKLLFCFLCLFLCNFFPWSIIVHVIFFYSNLLVILQQHIFVG